MPIPLAKLLLSDNLLPAIIVNALDILLQSAMQEDKINNLKNPDNLNDLLGVPTKTTLTVIIVTNLTLEVEIIIEIITEIITETEVSLETKTIIDLTELLLENVVEKDPTDHPINHPHPTIVMLTM